MPLAPKNQKRAPTPNRSSPHQRKSRAPAAPGLLHALRAEPRLGHAPLQAPPEADHLAEGSGAWAKSGSSHLLPRAASPYGLSKPSKPLVNIKIGGTWVFICPKMGPCRCGQPRQLHPPHPRDLLVENRGAAVRRRGLRKAPASVPHQTMVKTGHGTLKNPFGNSSGDCPGKVWRGQRQPRTERTPAFILST